MRQHRGMNKAALLPLCFVATLGAQAVAQTSPAPAALYRLDPQHTFVHFEVMHFGTSTARGRFGPIEGVVTLDRARGAGELSLRIPTATVSTGIGFFDARLRERDLLASADFPEAYFVATRFRFEGGQPAELRGEFTFRGVSQPLSLVARQFACRMEQATEVCGGEFEASLLRSEFGATFGLPFIGNRVRLLVQVEARRER
jgi:polyisoprenoid-binding protein YceI